MDFATDAALALMPAVREAAREAGRIACRYFERGAKTTARIWSKHGGSPVTEADVAVDSFLKVELSAALPAAAWLSEETADDPARLDARRVWIVDPIDGTRAFLSGHPDWCVAIALLIDGEPVLGVIAAPAHDTLYEGCRGGGAYRELGADHGLCPRATRGCERRRAEAAHREARASGRASRGGAPHPVARAPARPRRRGRGRSRPRVGQLPRLGPRRGRPHPHRGRRQAHHLRGPASTLQRGGAGARRTPRSPGRVASLPYRGHDGAASQGGRLILIRARPKAHDRQKRKQAAPSSRLRRRAREVSTGSNSVTSRSSTSSASTRTTPPPTPPGRPGRKRPSTTRKCAISSCICTGCLIHPRPELAWSG